MQRCKKYLFGGQAVIMQRVRYGRRDFLCLMESELHGRADKELSDWTWNAPINKRTNHFPSSFS